MSDVITGKPNDLVLFLMSADRDKLYDLTEHKDVKQRSLSANNYFFALVGKIADSIRISKTEVHNMMIARYGQMEYIDGQIVYFILPDKIDANRLEGVHLKSTSKTKVLDNGDLNRVYIVMRGSHTYNSKEMAILIDGVISEAEQLGIDTITTTEKDKMLERWAKEYESKKNKGLRDNTGSKADS